ncbi:MAG: hypothetical protein KDJ38_16440 [Gammaproteobacteria bacterium]|nr:hypothetical protein [Gammaproteobacteria bacterium]
MTNYIRALAVLFFLLVVSACEDSGSGGNQNPQDSTQGSRARFALIGDYLYTISGSWLQLFDITSPESPNPWARMQLEWDIETLFPYENYLLIGSRSGMHVLENSDPANPRYVTEFDHARSCDPVVAEGDIAFVTLRSSVDCWGEGASINQLDVIDIADITDPALIRSYVMQSPSGLAVDGGTLFICDSIAGLKVFDATDPAAITVLDVQADVDCYDVIARDSRLYVSEEDQLLQFDYSTFPMTLISSISVTTDS